MLYMVKSNYITKHEFQVLSSGEDLSSLSVVQSGTGFSLYCIQMYIL